MGRRRGDRVHPLRDHRLLHVDRAAPHPQPGPRSATAALRADAGVGDPDASRVASHEQHHRTERRERGAAPPCRKRADVQLPDRGRGRLHLPVRDRDRHVVQDGAERDRQPARPRAAPADDERVPPALQRQGLPPLGEELGDRDAQRHVPPRLPRQPRRLRARAPALPWARRRVRDDRRRDGGARRRAADPEVPDHPPARDLRHLLRDDHPAARRRRRRLHHEELLRVDPGQRRGVGADRRREHLPHLLVDRAADGAARAHHALHPVVPGHRGTSSRTSSSRRRARASTR